MIFYPCSQSGAVLLQISLIESYADVFVEGPLEEFTVTNFCRFTIQTFDSGPVYETSSLSYEDCDLLQEKVNELVESDYLESSNSNWSSPAKPKFINGNLELCVNFARLNEITSNFLYRVPSIPSVLNSIGESSIFSKVGSCDDQSLSVVRPVQLTSSIVEFSNRSC